VRERPPGDAFGYSGEGYNYLQTVVERLVGQPLDVYMREAMLEPLGMRASSYRWVAVGDPAVAAAHDRYGRPSDPYIGDRPEASSSLHTTPADYARFLCALLDTRTGPGRLRAESMAEVLRPQVIMGPRVAWGLGWGLEESGDRGAFWHWGDNPGYKSLTVAAPAQRTGTVIMTNGDGGFRDCAGSRACSWATTTPRSRGWPRPSTALPRWRHCSAAGRTARRAGGCWIGAGRLGLAA
jgi:CubicO group peptidase (beta-lactamase class C family)